jgi:hypothetical protein
VAEIEECLMASRHIGIRRNYQYAGPLANPINDASDIAVALTGLGLLLGTESA